MRTILFFIAVSCANLNAQSYDSLLRIGIRYQETSNLDSAMAIFNRAQILQPSRFDSWYYLSLSYFSKGNYKEATRFANEAIARNSQHAYSHALLGLSKISVDRISGCASLETAMRLDEDDEEVSTLFKRFCGKYYRIYIKSSLRDSTIIDHLQDQIGQTWTLTSIERDSNYLNFDIIHNSLRNTRENRSFEVEYGIFVFDIPDPQNLLTVKSRYKNILSQVNYTAYKVEGRELILAVIDAYLDLKSNNLYLDQKDVVIKQLLKFNWD